MLFSSISFLYYFLPLVLLVYFLMPVPRGNIAFRNAVLFIASFVFYYWGGYDYIYVIIVQIISGWLFGLLIDRWRGTVKARIALTLCTTIGIGALMIFKYADFFIENVNAATGSGIPLLKLALPIGISFYTFQILSYDFDLYMGKTNVQKSLFKLALYTMFFPQLIAGPIVRYADVEKELHSRHHSLNDFAVGARRFVMGLAKKVLVANVLGELVKILKTGGERSVLASWLCIVAFSLQIYYDFSGYSDMAIGMGRMFGFKFLENFNYPYIAKSITDFWRRWHMSLSSWLRDYIYIPLGGNRKRQVLNILIVWFVTGFWHGAGWNFIAWGLFFGFILLIEKFVWGKTLARAPVVVQHIYVLLIVLISFCFFDSANMGEAFSWIGGMFGVGVEGLTGLQSLYYLRSYMIPLLIAAIGATPVPKRLMERICVKQPNIAAWLEPAGVAALLILATAFLVDGSFNPFIYFRF